MFQKALARAQHDVEAQPIARADTVGQPRLGRQLAVAGSVEDFVLNERDVPAGEVRGGHRELAGREQPAAAFLGRRPRRPECVTHVAGGIVERQRRRVEIDDAGHLQWREHPFLQILKQRLAGRAFSNHARHRVARVAVLPCRTRGKIQWLIRPTRHDLLRCDRTQHLGQIVILRPIIADAGRMRQQRADARSSRRAQPGNPFAGRIVDRYLVRFLQQQKRGRGELLADRAHGVAHRRRRRPLRSELRPTVGLCVHDRGIAHQGDRRRRHAGARKDRVHRRVGARTQGLIRRWHRGGRCRCGCRRV